ncbi:MAG: acyltransferase [Gemmatimonadota bacterium]|nr:acyltransferase [Gemmatimonadota bacterium]
MTTSGRLLFVDGLRGVAALMVVAFHFHENIAPAVQAWLPSLATQLFLHGNLGVEVFFVLSGFVIAQSISAGERSLRYLGRFGLRRSIRLDPPLWVTILLECMLISLTLVVAPSRTAVLPSWSQLLANVTYTQHFLGYKDIVPVFWSLTFEVQFYVVAVSALIARRALDIGRIPGALIFCAAFTYSLSIWLELVRAPLPGLFIDRWFQFSLGVAAWLVCRQMIPATAALLGGASILALVSVSGAPVYRLQSTIACLVTAATMIAVGRSGRMGSLLDGKVIQFFGKISYSLYLVHLLVGWRLITLSRIALGPEFGPLLGTAIFLAAVISSVAAAWLMYLLVERPSIRFARRISLPLNAQLERSASVVR